MELSKFENGILKTGFDLEYRVSGLLRELGWRFISNKYYVDDVEGSVREIDILAYRHNRLDDIDVYTALIISCKKSEDRVWAVLSRDLDAKDPNANWFPYHGVSQHKAIHYQTSLPDWSKKYRDKTQEFGSTLMSIPSVDIFAFQEMDKKSGNVQNDKAIFSSISSLMKAQAYEIGSLKKRERKSKSVYQLNLVSVLAGDMVRLHFSGEGKPKATLTKTESYVSKYILNKQETSSRINFVVESELSKLLGRFNDLHDTNCRIFSDELDDFYSDILASSDKRKILIDEFRQLFAISVNRFLFANRMSRIDKDKIDLWASGPLVYIELGDDDELVSFMEDNQECKDAAAKVLKDVYRYDGRFAFIVDIPF